MESTEDVPKKGKGMKRGTIILVVFTIVILLVGMTIGLILYYNLPPASPPVPVMRSDTVGDCLPPGQYLNQTEANCQERG